MASTPKEFMQVTANHSAELTRKVKDLIEQGWQPYDSVITAGPTTIGMVVCRGSDSEVTDFWVMNASSRSALIRKVNEVTPDGWEVFGHPQTLGSQFSVALTKGFQGSSGGRDGMAGPQGPQGPRGEVGPEGPQGPKGDDGADGEKGERGAVGPQGPIAPQGIQGPQGIRGVTGSVGPQGPQGEKGDTGPQGPRGEAGESEIITYYGLAPYTQSQIATHNLPNSDLKVAITGTSPGAAGGNFWVGVRNSSSGARTVSISLTSFDANSAQVTTRYYGSAPASLAASAYLWTSSGFKIAGYLNEAAFTIMDTTSNQAWYCRLIGITKSTSETQLGRYILEVRESVKPGQQAVQYF